MSVGSIPSFAAGFLGLLAAVAPAVVRAAALFWLRFPASTNVHGILNAPKAIDKKNGVAGCKSVSGLFYRKINL